MKREDSLFVLHFQRLPSYAGANNKAAYPSGYFVTGCLPTQYANDKVQH